MTPATEHKKELFATALLKWWPSNRRDFPWRKRRDAYSVLIAEQLLRKTSAKQVDAVYEHFMKRFQNPRQLASATPKEIEELIRPLGIEKRRSITLYRFGLAVTKQFQSKIPRSRDALLTLPGVGEYAADAVRSLVTGDRLPMVDRNAVRVVTRIFSIDLPPNQRKATRVVRKFMLPLVRRHGAKNINLGLLDFAATVCTARRPKCSGCVMRDFCQYTQNEPDR